MKKQHSFSILRLLVILPLLAALYVLLLNIQYRHSERLHLNHMEATLKNVTLQLRESYQTYQLANKDYLNSLQAQADMTGYLYNSMPGKAPSAFAIQDALQLDALGIYLPNGVLSDGNVVFTGTCAFEDMHKLFADPAHPLFCEENGMIYAASRLENGSFLVIRTNEAQITAEKDRLPSAESLLSEQDTDHFCFVISLNKADHVLLGAPKTFVHAKIGQVVNLPQEVSGYITLDGVRYLYIWKNVMDQTLIALTAEEDLRRDVTHGALVTVCIMVFILILIGFYSLFLSEDERKGRAKSDRSIRIITRHVSTYYLGKIFNFLSICVLILFLISMYLHTLLTLSHQRLMNQQTLDSLETLMSSNQKFADKLTAQYEDALVRRAEDLSVIYSFNPELVTHEHAMRLAELAQVKSIFVMNKDGKTDATNTVFRDFTLNKSTTSQSYPFWDIVLGYSTSLVQEPRKNDTARHELMQYIGVTRRDQPGMVQLGIDPLEQNATLTSTDLSSVLNYFITEKGSWLFAIDKEKNTLLSWPDVKMIGAPADNAGVRSEALHDGYVGYQFLHGVNCMISGTEWNGLLIGIASQSLIILEDSFVLALIYAGACAVVLLISTIFSLMLPLYNSQRDMHIKADKVAIQSDSLSYLFERLIVGQNQIIDRINSMNAEQRLSAILHNLLSFTVVILFVRFAFAHRVISDTSTFSFIMSTKWEHSFNIFSITYIFIMSVEILTLTTLFRKALKWLSKTLSPHTLTVTKLVDNFIRYIAAIGTLLYCTQFVGIDSTMLLASAGVMTLALSLGAKSLVDDILSGVFIVFEHEFRVGDVVTINGFRGTVVSIGIRTTRVRTISTLDTDSNLRSFRNSQIVEIQNMTRYDSVAVCDIGISRDQSIEKLEEIMRRELPLLRERSDFQFMETPVYMGIVSFVNTSIIVRVAVKCEEPLLGATTAALNREVKLIFDRCGVLSPFAHSIPGTDPGKAITPAAPENKK